MRIKVTLYGIEDANQDQKLHNLAQALASAKAVDDAKKAAKLEKLLASRRQMLIRRAEHSVEPYAWLS